MEEQIAQVEKRVHDANAAVSAALEQAQAAKAELDNLVSEHEAQKQAVYYGIGGDEARQRIDQNRHERATGSERTIFPLPNNQGGV